MPTTKDVSFPLSSVQQLVWLDQSLHLTLPLYHIGAALLLEGALDVARLEQAITLFAEQNDALRITLKQDDSGVRQEVLSAIDVSLPLIDFSCEPDSDGKARECLGTVFTAPFDLHGGLLWSMCLIRTAHNRHYWVQRYHHVVADGSSVALAITGIAGLYNALGKGEAALAAQDSSYLDYVAGDRVYLQSPRFDQDRTYWRVLFPELPPVLLPRRDQGKNAAPSEQIAWTLPRDLFERLSGLAAQHEASAMHMMLALVSLYFARAQDLDEIVIGVSVHNRSGRERHTVGMFSSMIPVKISVPRDQSFAGFMQAVASTLRQCYRHRRFPIAEINRDLELWRTERRQIFDVSLSFESFDVDCAFGGVRPRILPQQNGYEQTPLAFFVRDYHHDDDVTVELNYNCAFLDRSEADQIRTRLALLLREALADGGQATGHLPLLTAQERDKVVRQFNSTARAYPADLCLHELFEAQTHSTPDAPAVTFEHAQISYADLNARANRLAHHLGSLGVRPDARVAICLERSVEMVIALLATLKAGAAYVPLDPNLPAARLVDMLTDCAPAALLNDGSRIVEGVPAIDVRDASAWGGHSGDNPGRHAFGLSPEHLAYVIYTSGSTGKPKGVMIEHRSIANRLFWMQEAYPLDATDAVLQKTPYGFDVSVWEFFWPLSFGARLVMARPQGHMDPAYLNDIIRRERITTLHFVPSMLQVFLAHDGAAQCHGVKRVVCSGEALPTSLAQRFHDCLPQTALHNLYGPTEAAVDVTALTWTADMANAGMSIGRPIANTAIYILDRLQQPVAPGMVGELHIGGIQVARGYWNRPELSAERFVADPFGGTRLYKTGDLGRWREDGTIEYLGRNDFQVKIRGFRIELGEIESRLAGHPLVQEAVLVARTDGSGEQRLVAYYIGAEELPAAALRSHLAAMLPDYMVPAAFVRMDRWPVTSNGKLDRKALPEPEYVTQTATAHAEPEGDVELAVANMWQELLGRERVGRHDHFFELGGHSLKAAQLMSRVRTQFAVDLPLTTLFTHPVLADFASIIDSAAPAALQPIATSLRDGRLPLSFAQQRLWFMAQLEHASAAYHLAGGLTMNGTLDHMALGQTLDRIIQRHEALRTSFRANDGQPVQVVGPSDSGFALSWHDLRDQPDPEAELRRLAQQEADAPFDLEHGPLIRGRLVRLGEKAHVLLITMHHIVSDGWSISVLFNEFAALYAAFSQGQPDPLPALPIQYVDYALWQRRWLQGPVLQRQLDFWTGYLAAAPSLLELPTDRPRPAIQNYAGASIDFQFDAGVTKGLRSLGKRHGTTLFMTMLASWTVVLARLSGQSDLVIGSPVANRQRTELEVMIGFFINTLALRVDLSDAPTVAQLLERIKQSTLAAQSHQDIPFEQVVELVNPVRTLAHHPLFQVAFTWQNAPEGVLDVSGLDVTHFATPQTLAKTDCWLVAGEAGEGIAGTMNYATALFDRSTIERHLAQWKQVAQAMLDNDHESVHRLALLTPTERRHMLMDWNATAFAFPHAPLLPQWFEQQAARTPDATALVQGERQLSYAQLNSRANRLAHHLIALGAGPDTRIAIGMRRGIDMVVALLAALKSGAAYVPLDPGYPAERLAYLLADSAPLALLTQSGLRDAWGSMPEELTRIELDAEHAAWADRLESNPPVAAAPGDLAYMIYTSGSTGHPKGVMIEHAALLNYLHWAVQTYRPVKGSVVSSSVAFDATITSLYTPLLCGASVTLLEEGEEIEGLEALLLAPQGAGLIKITPAHLEVLGRRIEAEGKPCDVDVFVIGGEALAPSTVQLWKRIAPAARLVNEYGPTETVVGCASYEVEGAAHSVPIGRPIANMRMYVLDADRQPVPLGVAGELYIGGAGVGRGYWKRPDLTAERFVHDPFSGEANARLYRTGDLGRWRADGNLEYLGRNDFQVKIRGFRIELGEIEAHLAACDGVRDAAVLAREDSPGEKRLVAYYTGLYAISASALREHLGEKLPDYMLPAAYVKLDTWPLTQNGKLDRHALPKPGDDAYATGAFAAPQGEVEQALARIWSDLLDIEQIGRHDDFFLLDGNSLLAVQLIARIRQQFGVTVGLAELFGNPVLADFAACIDAATPSDLPAISTASRDASLPLSFAQQRLWFLAQLEKASGAYHIAGGLAVHGRLNRAALEHTLDRILQRHEALRTSFWAHDGEPVQVIAPPDTRFALAWHDLHAHPAAGAELQRMADKEASAPFDLERGPLIRGRLVCLREDAHVLLITMHHTVSDGWSISVLFKELSALYAAFRQGHPDPLPPLPVQYADYALWQRRWLQGKVLQHQLDFWSGYLAGAPALLELPSDRPRPAMQDFSGARIGFSFDATLTAALKALSQRHGATMFMTLLAAWAVVLARVSGQSDLVIGSPVANRKRTELESLIGFFVNTLALRVDLSGTPTVAELLARVKHSTLAAQGHQDIPFEQVVDVLKPERTLAHSPLFQVMLSWNNLPERHLELPELRLELLEAPESTAKFDLSVSLHESDDAICGSFDYATALFDHATIERHLAQWRQVLEAMVANDQQTVNRLALLTPAERRHMLVDWNATACAFPHAPLLPQWFEQQAARTPDATALVQGERQLSYAQLNSRANRLAHHLIALDAGPNTRIAIGMRRGIDMVVALLAALKSGAAYVPLDPGYPAERLAYLLADSAPLALLTQSGLRDAWGTLPEELTRIELDAEHAAWADRLESNPPVAAAPGDLAYMIYTSGSTGHPKGVMIEHAALLNYLHWAVQTYRPVKGSVVSSSVAFDATITSLYLPLLCGASVTLLEEGEEIEGLEALLLAPQGAGLVKITPAHLEVLGRRIEAEGKPCDVDVFVIGGEALAPSTVQLWQRIAPAARLVNEYGPTETVVGCASYEVEGAAHSVPIGRPIANMRMYVLDPDRQPVPLGVTGELYIGGAGVGRGYWKRPDLTAERFVHDPFSGEANARLYKTGDLGRWRADGNLEYLGRNDFQVKIRGFRIELGEIEAHLAACDGVRDAAVLAREDVAGEKRLVAYYTGPNAAPAPELRMHLAQRLPDYMLPVAFVKLDTWPLTPNGKLDRHALPKPEGAAHATRTFVQPQGELELEIARVWRELLNLDQVGRHDHFFELGGHSLLAVRLVARLRRTLDLDIAVRELFSAPVLCEFVQVVKQAKQAALPPIVRERREGALPLSAMQQRLWVLDQLDSQAGLAYHMPAALRLQGKLDLPALQAAFNRLLARHESLRTTFVMHEGQPAQVIAPATSEFSLKFHTLEGGAQDAAIERLIQEALAAPFDLHVGPLIRAHLLQLSDEEHVLLLIQHHIVSDGWSIGVMIDEFNVLYGAFAQGHSDPLPALPIQYADYALWQRRWLQGETRQAHLDFWRAHLSGAPALLDLPADRPRPPVQSHAGALLEFSLDAGLTTRLRQLAQQHGCTMFMTLLAGWAALMGRMAGQDDVVIGTPVANRQHAEVEGLIGFFVNTLALRVRLDANLNVAGLLEQVRASTLGAYAHQDLPFEQVVDTLQPARSAAHSPLFQVMLAWDNTPSKGDLSLPGLSVTPLPVPHTTTQFDLSLSLREEGKRIVGRLEYATALFERESVARLVTCFRDLLGGMAGDARQTVSSLPMLDEAGRNRVLIEFNDTSRDFPHGRPIHEVFEQQVARQPQAFAVLHEDHHLSYQELNERANQVAHALLKLGVQPDDRVGLCAERGADMIVAVLGILKAGAAYVPLDPAHPAPRIAHMLADSAPAALLTQTALRAGLPTGAAAVIELDSAQLADQPTHNPDVRSSPHNLAYVIYTSGSTGQPKGVLVEHASVINLWQAMEETAFRHCGPDARIGLNAALSFDASVQSFAQLLSGRGIVIIPAAVRTDGQALLAFLRARQVDAFDCTPSQLALLLPAGLLDEATPGPHTVLIGGEAIGMETWQALRNAKHMHCYNVYGPTECCVNSTLAEIRAADERPHLGRPLANTRAYVLDENRQPVPIGVVGELYIGGAGVAREYWQRPQLTAERFMPDPFGAEGRLYKTGDLVRWRADGTLDYLGRNDFQVKLRGFRIELGEIEAALAACTGVQDAVVLARAERLIAYYGGAGALSAEQLRTQMANRLPDYMLPVAFVKMDVWPLTPNGKLDRNALPQPEGDAHASRAYAPPRCNTEIAIAGIWQELLGVERIGRHDHFFELGGHSLLAIQVSARLRSALGCNIAVRDLFSAPELAAFAQVVQQARRTSLPAITVTKRDGPPLASLMQQRLWLLDQLDPAAGVAYHMPAGLRLHGRLDQNALQAALDRLLARHESLRTTFALRGGQTIQVIAPSGSAFALDVRDLRSVPEDAHDSAIGTVAQDAVTAAFDLGTGPLIRGSLLRLADDDHILLVVQHHIISDGWSIGVMIDEFNTLYRAFCQGHPDPLPPLAVQYADYAHWQRNWLQGELRQAHVDFWRTHLHAAPDLLNLPTDRPRPAMQSHDGALLEFCLDASLANSVRRLSQQHGCTLFMTLLAGWAVLMGRMAGQDDVVIGTPVANRQHTEVEGLIGFFVNTLPLRVKLTPDARVADLLAQVKAGTLDAYAHQDLPFEQIVDALQPTRSTRHSALFQVMLAWDNTPAKGQVALPGLSVAPVSLPHTGSQFDLSLSLRESADGIVGSLEYATALFDAASIERLAGYFRNVLAAMADDGDRRLADVPLLDAAARHALLIGLNDTSCAFPLDQTYASLFAQQVLQHPERVAVVCNGVSLTYRELDERSARVARALIAAGARPNTLVAVVGKRDVPLLVMMIAVLRSGAAFLTLDVKQPAERLRAMMGLSQAALVLASEPSLHLLDEITRGLDAAPHRLVVESLWHAGPVAPLEHPGTPGDLAYVIFTSGSTGQPKGVMIEQRGMLNNMLGKVPTMGLCAHDRVAQTASPAFDIYVWQFLAAALVGATVHILPDEVVLDPQGLVASIEQQQLTLLEIVPSMMRSLLDAAPAGATLSSLRWVLPTGEALPLKVAQDWFDRFPALPLMNLYGPAECSDDVAFHAITARPEHGIPVGRPTPNNQLFILDDSLQPVPLGVQGEICVAGVGVGRGYWNAPELTKAAFVDHPFAPGQRFYRTGDLGRYLVDGSVEYLGRTDFQVKIRGCRIELGEIEARLLACDGITDAAVMARADLPGDLRLVAYVIAGTEGNALPATLRAQLSASLPDYMVPSAFVLVTAFPRTANGKLDRLALPPPDAAALFIRDYEAPQGQVETTLAQLWQDVLGVAQVGRHDNFFELGGHSLNAMTLVMRMREAFQIALPAKAVFEHAELAQLADSVTAAQIALYLDNETEAMAADLDCLSEEELLAILDEDTSNG